MKAAANVFHPGAMVGESFAPLPASRKHTAGGRKPNRPQNPRSTMEISMIDILLAIVLGILPPGEYGADGYTVSATSDTLRITNPDGQTTIWKSGNQRKAPPRRE